MSAATDVAGGSPSQLSRERQRQAEMFMKREYQDDHASEGISLLKPDAPPTIDEEIAERRLGMFFWILIIVGFSGFVAFWGWDREIVQIITRYFASRESTTTADLYIMAFNEYGSFSAPYSWLDSVSGSQIVEPYKETTLSLNGAYASGSTFKWALDYPSEEEATTWTGSDTKEILTLTEPGSYSITVEAFDVKTGSFRGRYTTLLMVKYVRREIRSLSEADRARFSQAAKLMWNTSTDEGRELFGPDFTSIATFSDVYLYNSNKYRCDSYHDGSGWFTHHFALSNSFEASLQAIDPAVALPYWDFTIEGQAITDAGEGPDYLMKISPIFSSSYFGAVNATTNTVQDSAWQGVEVPTSLDGGIADDSLLSAQNGWGFMRSLWNLNSARTISRHPFSTCGVVVSSRTIPDCDAHFDLVDSPTLEDFQLLSPSESQSSLHPHIGGVFGGCTEAYANFSSTWSSVLDSDMTVEEIEALGYSWSDWDWGLQAPRREMIEDIVIAEYHHIYRSLWRSHMCARDATPYLLECPASSACLDGRRRKQRGLAGNDDDDDGDDDKRKAGDDDGSVSVSSSSSCSCSVPGLGDSSYDWENVYYCVVSEEEDRDLLSRVMPPLLLQELTVLVGTASVEEGEMAETGGQGDILFWLISPTIERLLAAKRLSSLDSFGGTGFSKWESVDGSNETWLTYSYYSQTAGENAYFPSAYTCQGHAPGDAVLPSSLPLQGGLGLYDADNDGVVSNLEMFQALDPNDGEALYVFDSLDWDHCRGSISNRRERQRKRQRDRKRTRRTRVR